MKTLIAACALSLACTFAAAADTGGTTTGKAPAAANPLYPAVPARSSSASARDLVDLSGWNLQIPGGASMTTIDSAALLAGYGSRFLTVSGSWVLLSLDAAESGFSTNAHYARAELRHAQNWGPESEHRLRVTIRAQEFGTDAGFTVAQIHKIPTTGDTSPTLRIEIRQGAIRAVIKDDGKYETVALAPYTRGDSFDLGISAHQRTLIIDLDGKEACRRTLSVWPAQSYFKTGCYPQSNEGFFRVYLKNLSAY